MLRRFGFVLAYVSAGMSRPASALVSASMKICVHLCINESIYVYMQRCAYMDDIRTYRCEHMHICTHMPLITVLLFFLFILVFFARVFIIIYRSCKVSGPTGEAGPKDCAGIKQFPCAGDEWSAVCVSFCLCGWVCLFARVRTCGGAL